MMNIEEPVVVIPRPASPAAAQPGGSPRPCAWCRPARSRRSRGPNAELDPASQIAELEQQRNVLAILYQLSLRCLTAVTASEAEKLIANVLPRLVPLGLGLYPLSDAGRLAGQHLPRIAGADPPTRRCGPATSWL